MSLSQVTLAARERPAADMTAFSLAGVPYILWRSQDFLASRLWWRRHDGAETTEVALDRALTYVEVAAVGRVDDATVFIAYTQGAGDRPTIYGLVADVATGATVVEPYPIAVGTKPALATLAHGSGRLALIYRDGQTGAVHLRESYDDGATWDTAKPVLNNKVNATEDLSLVAFDGTHLSIGQVGAAGRLISEDGSAERSRPVSAVLGISANRMAVIEATIRTGQVVDNVRGRAALDGLGNVIAASRTRLGTDDGVGSLATYDTVYDAPALVGSAILAAGAAPGGEIVRAPLVPPGAGAVIATVASSEAVLDLAVFDGHALYGAYASTAATGRAGWVNLDTLAAGEFDLGLGVTRVGAIAAGAAAAGGFDLVAVGYTAGGAHYLRLGEWTNPPSGVTLGAVHAVPAAVNSLAVSLQGATQGTIFVGLADRVNVYAFDGLGQPIRLIRSHILLTGGEVHQLLARDNGNIVAALGIAGIAVFAPGGETLGVGQPSSIPAMPWKPAKAYGVGDLVRPTDKHPYAPQRRYFICTRAGTSGTNEPSWGPYGDPTGTVGVYSGTTNDPNGAGAGWQEVGSILPIISGVAVEQAAGRIYAVGVLGGAAGTAGRIYNFDAGGLVSAPPRCGAPQFSLAEAAVVTTPWRLTIMSGTAGATIYYTTDGSTPGPNATLYDPDVGLFYEKSGAHHIRAVALAPNLRPSLRTEVHYTIDLPDLPAITVNPDFGVYLDQAFDVDLSCAEPGVTIRYTLDGSEPTETHGTIYAGPFHVADTTVIKARGFKYAYDDTPLLSGQITITRPLIPRLAAPTSHFLVSNGIFTDFGAPSWNEIGAVPRVAAAPILGKLVEGVGPTAVADYFELAGSSTGTDVFDTLFTGDFIATLVFQSGLSGDNLFGNWAGGAGGIMFMLQSASPSGFRIYNLNGTFFDLPGTSILDGAVHVVTLARKGNAYFAKIDGQAVQTGTITWPAAATNAVTRIGRSGYTTPVYRGVIYEGRFAPVTIDGAADIDALHAAIGV